MSTLYRIELCSESTLKDKKHCFRLRGTKGVWRHMNFILGSEIEDEMHIWTLSTCKYMCICKQHIWHSCIYVVWCTYTHTSTHGVCMSFQTYTHILLLSPLGDRLVKPAADRQADWPFASGRMSWGRILHVAGSQIIHHYSWIREDNTKARPGIRMNPFCRIV